MVDKTIRALLVVAVIVLIGILAVQLMILDELGSLDAQAMGITNLDQLQLETSNYPLEYTSSGKELVWGVGSITGTGTASHGLTTVTFAVCTLGEDPTSGSGDAAMCTASVSGNVVTLKTWQDDFVTAATEGTVVVHWLVVGTP